MCYPTGTFSIKVKKRQFSAFSRLKVSDRSEDRLQGDSASKELGLWGHMDSLNPSSGTMCMAASDKSP